MPRVTNKTRSKGGAKDIFVMQEDTHEPQERQPTDFTNEERERICRECGGRCCFTIPYTHDMVDIRGFLAAGDVSMLAETEEEQHSLLREFQFIFDNWVQIPVIEAKKTATYEIPGWSTEEGNSHYYNCTKWDRNTGKCTAYKQRPPNCRGFPFFGEKDPKDSSDYLGCLLVKEAKRRKRQRERRKGKSRKPDGSTKRVSGHSSA